MKKLFSILMISVIAAMAGACVRAGEPAGKSATYVTPEGVTLGAARTDVYLPLLEGKRVGLYSNQTGMVGDKHSLDLLKEGGADVRLVFSPEHGFRGTADAGEHVSTEVDPKTGVKILSLYGPGSKQAMEEGMDSIDVVVVDIQDVGLRYYTYYITMLQLMEKAAEKGKSVMVLDRPNPLGMTVDGPILDPKYASGVGQLAIPVVHGLTLGEMADMIVGEKWLRNGKEKLDLTVIPMLGYTHDTRYRLPVAPSPNLRDMTAVYLYPSVCFFEGTPASLGRGTDKPFKVYGHPDMKNRSFSFTPQSVPGAKNPPLLGKLCHGVDLSGISDDEAIAQGINLSYLIDAYRDVNIGDEFLTKFFNLLIGNGETRKMIADGMSAEEIKATWKGDVDSFKELRRRYLLYPEETK